MISALRMNKLSSQLSKFSELIAFRHTLFGLPITLLACFLAMNLEEVRASMTLSQGIYRMLGIIFAFTMARTAGMALNRLFDHAIDAKNPRTAQRALPSGLITRKQVRRVAYITLFLFLAICFFFNMTVVLLAPLVMLLLVFYSLAKRATAACHFILGGVEFFAPFLAWLAFTDTLSMTAYVLGGAIGFWISGIDLLYALQDVSFDRSFGIYSFPSQYGRKATLILAKILHSAALICLAWAGFLTEAAWPYWLSLVLVTAVFVGQHIKVDSRYAFFLCNALISLFMLLGAAGSAVVRTFL